MADKKFSSFHLSIITVETIYYSSTSIAIDNGTKGSQNIGYSKSIRDNDEYYVPCDRGPVTLRCFISAIIVIVLIVTILLSLRSIFLSKVERPPVTNI